MSQKYDILYNTRTGNLHLKKPKGEDPFMRSRSVSPVFNRQHVQFEANNFKSTISQGIINNNLNIPELKKDSNIEPHNNNLNIPEFRKDNINEPQNNIPKKFAQNDNLFNNLYNTNQNDNLTRQEFKPSQNDNIPNNLYNINRNDNLYRQEFKPSQNENILNNLYNTNQNDNLTRQEFKPTQNETVNNNLIRQEFKPTQNENIPNNLYRQEFKSTNNDTTINNNLCNSEFKPNHYDTTVNNNLCKPEFKNSTNEKINIEIPFKQKETKIYNEKNNIEIPFLQKETKIYNENDNIINKNYNLFYKNDNQQYKNLTFGIKKSYNTEVNFLNSNIQNPDFKILCSKNATGNSKIYDCFYLFPNIIELNSKSDVNIINDKKIESFMNINDSDDIQYFPMDYIPTGNLVKINDAKKIIIRNISWIIFQSIKSDNFQNNEILSMIPDRSEYIFSSVKLQINFELHSQVSQKIEKQYYSEIFPYKNDKFKNPNGAKTCLFPIKPIIIDNLNGNSSEDLIIEIPDNLYLNNALLCIKISVPNNLLNNLRGFDKNSSELYGSIPFSQFILNFDYNII